MSPYPAFVASSSPLLPPLLAITHGNLTHALWPSSLGPSWSRRSSPGLTPLCWVQNMGHSGNPHPLPPTPLGSTGASAPFNCKNVSSAMPLPPLPRADCPGTGANQTGHQGHSRKASSLPVASPSTLGDQIYLMVKGLAGPGSQNIQGLGPPCALVPLLGLGPRVAELHHPFYSFKSAFYVDAFERKQRFYFSLLVVSALVLGSHSLAPGAMLRRE